MKLTKTIVVFDLETTGTWIDKDKIIEIGIVRITPDGNEEEYHQVVNPGMVIPDFIVELIGISNDDVKDKPPFKKIAQEVIDFIGDADLGGFNIRKFDLPLLMRELNEAGLNLDMKNRFVYDAQTIFHLNEKRDLTAAYKFYCNKDLEGAHSALVDTRATWDVFKGQLEKYVDNGDFEALKEFEYQNNDEFYDPDRRFRWWNGELYMMFGKYAKQSLKEVAKRDPNYLEWILNKDFNEDVKVVVEQALNGQFPVKV